MELIPSNIEIQEDNLFSIHIERFKLILQGKDELDQNNLSLSNDEIESVKELKKEIKNQILLDFVSLKAVDPGQSVSTIIIISFQYIMEKYQIELAIKSLTKCLQNNIYFTFNSEIINQLILYIDYFNQIEKIDMVQKIIDIINIFIKKYSEGTDTIFLSELVHSGFPMILLKCDMKLTEVACSIWYLLRIQINDHPIFSDPIYDDDNLKIIMKNSIDVLHAFINILSNKEELLKYQNDQFDKLLKYLFKCISIFPHDFNFDCLLTDIVSTIATSSPSLKIKEIAIRSSIRRNFKNMHISFICFNLIKEIISEIEIQRKADKASDKLFITCINYLNYSFSCWFNNSESTDYLELAISIIEYITDNKSFNFVNSILPIAEQIINKTHWISMKFEEMLINHIDISELGKICLITSFMATENMMPVQFYESLNMYIEIYPILDDLYNSEQCDTITRWIIEAIWASVEKYLDQDLD